LGLIRAEDLILLSFLIDGSRGSSSGPHTPFQGTGGMTPSFSSRCHQCFDKVCRRLLPLPPISCFQEGLLFPVGLRGRSPFLELTSFPFLSWRVLALFLGSPHSDPSPLPHTPCRFLIMAVSGVFFSLSSRRLLFSMKPTPRYYRTTKCCCTPRPSFFLNRQVAFFLFLVFNPTQTLLVTRK